TATLFFIIPRVGQASLPIRAELRRMITGFTSQVELGAIGEIETDTTVVMRVTFPELGMVPADLLGLRWRGITLDQFDGRAWTASHPERRALRAGPSGLVRVAPPRGTARIADDHAKARRLTDYLAREYRYSLTQARSARTDPLEDFLFVRRSGNCEYFATALTVMLRTVGVPARVVNGFQRGEWNPYGEYFAVRLSDAHSWVEAWIDGTGWITFDASPRVEAASA